MPQTRAQIWGTLKRYLAYTAAGFVVLGGVGAMQAAQPPLVAAANASQTLRDSVSAEALMATAPNTPSWTQRLRFDQQPTAAVVAATAPAKSFSAEPVPAPYYPAPDTADAVAAESAEPVVADAAPTEAASESAVPAEDAPIAAAEPVAQTASPAEPILLTPPVVVPAVVPAVVPEVVASAAPAVAPVAAPVVETVVQAASPVAEPAAAPAPAVETVASDAQPAPQVETQIEALVETQVDVAAQPAIQPTAIAPTVEPILQLASNETTPATVETVAAKSEPTPQPAPANTASRASSALVATLDFVFGGGKEPAPSADLEAAAIAPAEDGITPIAADIGPAPTSPMHGTATALASAESAAATAGEKRIIAVRRGDTLFGLLTEAGLTEAEAQAAGHSLADVFSPSDLKVGQEITLNFATGAGPDLADGNKLVGLTLAPSMERDVKLTRGSDGQFIAASIDKPLTERVDRAAGQIDVSLFETARETGVPVGLIGEIIKAFSYDVDFQRDIHEGDSFEAMFERFDNEQGDLAKAGRLLYASLILSGKPMGIYYFERDGDGEYFTADGVAVRKSLLKTPIDGAKITSGYGMRVNPVLGYSAMHQGIDFGAPTGTPIFAAGNGVIEEEGWKNGYGNWIKIRHNGTYETGYAHISRFASGLKRGAKVKQGQVIAYVGTTGRSTGPHLHFEIMINGAHVNPSTVKTVSSDKLNGKDLKAFKAQVASVETQRRSLINRAEIADQSGGAVQLDCNRQHGGCPN